ncbi:hypothetical protein V6N13_029912 [Hibiscus sabdariffa]
MNLKQGQPVVQVVAAHSRAPIDKLVQHRAYPFAGIIEEKPEEAEYWLEPITQIVTEQLSCSDEHKLECAVALLVDEALSWWETTTLTTPTEKVTCLLVGFTSTTNMARKHEEKVVDRKLKDPGVIIYQDLNRDDHFIRDCPRNIQKVLTQPPAESSFAPPVRNEGSKKVQFGNQGRGKGNHSKASTHQEF